MSKVKTALALTGFVLFISIGQPANASAAPDDTGTGSTGASIESGSGPRDVGAKIDDGSGPREVGKPISSGNGTFDGGWPINATCSPIDQECIAAHPETGGK